MRAIVLRRLLQAIPLLFGITTLTFALFRLAPGDPFAAWADDPRVSEATLQAMRHRFGLDLPWIAQYGLYLRNVLLHLDFGESFSRHRPVFDVLREGLGNTLLLAVAGAIVTWGLAIPLGVWAAVRRGRPADRGLSAAAAVGLAVPEVLSGLLLLMLAARTGWFPVGGMRSLDWDTMGPAARAADLLRHLALPAIAVGIVPLAGRMRQMRASLLDVLRLDFVVTARAKGLAERDVVLRHALRNALHPLITIFGFTLGSLLSGALVTEVIFSWPGLGRLTYEALATRDQYLVMGTVQMAALVLVLGNLAADLLLAIADPRVAHA